MLFQIFPRDQKYLWEDSDEQFHKKQPQTGITMYQIKNTQKLKDLNSYFRSYFLFYSFLVHVHVLDHQIFFSSKLKSNQQHPIYSVKV